MPAPSPRILVIRRRYLGDIVLLGPLLRNLRLHWPDAHLAVLVEPHFADVPRLHLDVNAVLPLGPGAGGWWRLLRALRTGSFTHVLDLDNTGKTALLTRWTGARCRVGLHHGGFPLRRRGAYTHAVHDPAEQHESRSISEYYMCVLPVLHVPVVSRELRLVPTRPDELKARALLDALPGAFGEARSRRILVHPGTRSVFRRWPAECFVEICRRAPRELSAAVAVVGGPGDEDIVQEIAARAPAGTATISDVLPVSQLAAVAARCSVLLCHDSGPMHLAAGVGTPVVALFGSQNAALWQPAGNRHAVLQPPLPCEACVAPGTCVPADSYRTCCVRRIDVETVMAALRRVLDGKR